MRSCRLLRCSGLVPCDVYNIISLSESKPNSAADSELNHRGTEEHRGKTKSKAHRRVPREEQRAQEKLFGIYRLRGLRLPQLNSIGLKGRVSVASQPVRSLRLASCTLPPW